ncbi:hypothetical protein C6P45_000782 [Maudiozyma exigua]|uniref:Arginase n=1 Tax=Maudiozyma exigua TaxID=34358 RepID=A0A9P7BBX2_MAUEX|nr:hypothetical protein C6P45_000782 [Kazachstania exigua]
MAEYIDTDTIRVILPNWQGGCLKEYHFGAQLLEWLAPKTDMPTVAIKTDDPITTENDEKDQYFTNNSAIVKLMNKSREDINKYNPKRIVTLGGDCLASYPSFSYLADKYKDDLGILWIDTHPDISLPGQFNHSHAYPVAALIGRNSMGVRNSNDYTMKGSKIMIAGIHDPLDHEAKTIRESGVQTCSPGQVQMGSQTILDWIKRENIKYLAIHIDLDVLNEQLFHSLYFSRPDVDKKSFDGIAQGKLNMSDIITITNLVEKETDIVGLTIAEYLPWDAINLKNMLENLPLVGKK